MFRMLNMTASSVLSIIYCLERCLAMQSNEDKMEDDDQAKFNDVVANLKEQIGQRGGSQSVSLSFSGDKENIGNMVQESAAMLSYFFALVVRQETDDPSMIHMVHRGMLYFINSGVTRDIAYSDDSLAKPLIAKVKEHLGEPNGSGASYPVFSPEERELKGDYESILKEISAILSGIGKVGRDRPFSGLSFDRFLSPSNRLI